MTLKIGFLGFGSMAQALCKGALSSGILSATDVFFTQRNAETGNAVSQELGIHFVETAELINAVDILVLGFKPQQLDEALASSIPLPNSLTVVSLLAGTSTTTLQTYCEATTGIVRTMPNTPALLNAGITAFCTTPSVKPNHLNFIQTFLSSVGEAQQVEEDDMDIVTALSGSGPAFFYSIARDMIREGEAQGLSSDVARKLVQETLIGAGKMLQNSSSSPESLISDVASPGGTTEAGLTEYDTQNISDSLQSVIKAAANRSRTLRQEKESS